MKSVFQYFTVLLLVGSNGVAEENWPRFRGPEGRGHSTETNLPVSWDESNIVWSVDLDGVGQSSPVNWGDKLFLTNSSPDGTERNVVCLSRTDGSLLWEQGVSVPEASETPHKMNTFATPTCATDGERVVAFFGQGGLHCYDLDGNKLWERKFGNFPGPWGTATSPIIDGNRVILNLDAEGASSLVALDKTTGNPIWETPRVDKPKGGWCTPMFIEANGRRELILNGEFGVRGYSAESGEELWFCSGFTGRGAPVPDFAHETLYVLNGKPGPSYAVKPGGSGDVSNSHRLWSVERKGGRDMPSPAVVGDFLTIVSLSGIVSSVNAKSGELLFEERLEGEFAASPLVANGLVYFQSVQGDVIVLRPGADLNVVSRNSLNTDGQDEFRSTLAPIQGQIFIRSQRKLYCIGS